MSPPNSVKAIKDLKRCTIHLFSIRWLCLTLALPVLIAAFPARGDQQPAPAQRWSYQLLKTLPHSRDSFTQGLVKDGDFLIESSGRYRKSFLHRYLAHPDTSNINPANPDLSNSDLSNSDLSKPSPNANSGGYYKPLANDLFAEGLALLDNKLYMLTWRKQRALVFDPKTLEQLHTLRYQGEGWGLATYGQQLVMSNGSSQLSFRNRHNFAIERTVTVSESGRPLTNINDLTVAQDLIWANIWFRNDIVAIDPHSGLVVGLVSLEALVKQHPRVERDVVLNGIAWDEQAQAFWVTGKYWDKRYLIRISQ